MLTRKVTSYFVLSFPSVLLPSFLRTAHYCAHSNIWSQNRYGRMGGWWVDDTSTRSPATYTFAFESIANVLTRKRTSVFLSCLLPSIFPVSSVWQVCAGTNIWNQSRMGWMRWRDAQVGLWFVSRASQMSNKIIRFAFFLSWPSCLLSFLHTPHISQWPAFVSKVEWGENGDCAMWFRFLLSPVFESRTKGKWLMCFANFHSCFWFSSSVVW